MAKWFLKNHDLIHVNSSVAGKYNKHKQNGSHLGFPNRMILATVDLQVTLILPMNFESIAISFQGKSSKQIFKMGAMAAIWDFLSQRFEVFFLSRNHPDASYQVSSQLVFQYRRRKGKIDFQDIRHLGFPIGTILAIFTSTSYPDASYQFSNQLALWFRKISEKKRVSNCLDLLSKQFKIF